MPWTDVSAVTNRKAKFQITYCKPEWFTSLQTKALNSQSFQQLPLFPMAYIISTVKYLSFHECDMFLFTWSPFQRSTPTWNALSFHVHLCLLSFSQSCLYHLKQAPCSLSTSPHNLVYDFLLNFSKIFYSFYIYNIMSWLFIIWPSLTYPYEFLECRDYYSIKTL